ncbi:hypothetical protein [Nocardia sp. NPDC051832]|uniref:hypothetical protein n=1 Tax=Nocardia sp. NPDC051832 TaxID=3155673 RepID=UPI00341ECE08
MAYIALTGAELRYVLINELFVCGPLSVAELAAAVAAKGFAPSGRASKAISDALRCEVRRGRVYRIGRGRYRCGEIPQSSMYYIRTRLCALDSQQPAI